MIKFGFEREFFITDAAGKFTLATAFPHDDCGLLVEARGEIHSDPFAAAALCDVAQQKLARDARQQGLCLQTLAYAKVPRDLQRAARRVTIKGPEKHANVYNTHKQPKAGVLHAGLHVHFSDAYEIFGKAGDKFTAYRQLDIPTIVHRLDRVFMATIKATGRVPGSYELKPYGFEYRSLPATVDPLAVAEMLHVHKLL
jgi:hypothetical protein